MQLRRDLVAARTGERPTHIGPDVDALLQPVRSVVVDAGKAGCNGQQARQEDGRIVLAGSPDSAVAQYDALWAVAGLAWSAPYLDAEPALAVLDLID